MVQFPSLKTGVSVQYPVERVLEYSTQVERFVDGSEQRYRDRSTGRREWVIELSQLDEGELSALRSFFTEVRGRANTFDFVDPWTGGPPKPCRFASDSLGAKSFAEFDSRTRLIVVEAA